MALPNPHIIQEVFGPQSTSTVPLVLIHDGGGMTFEYHLLPLLDPPRPVYGIRNPTFHGPKDPSGFPELWPGEGGMPEMARAYEVYVKDALKAERANGADGKKVLLGGWSLGGMIALELARQIALRQKGDGGSEEDGVEIAGVVLIDSVFPYHPSAFPTERNGKPITVTQHKMTFAPKTQAGVAENVSRCMQNAVDMVGTWDPPRCDGDGDEGVEMPPVLLLRAKDYTSVVQADVVGSEEGAGKAEERELVLRVDIDRHLPLLGWDAARPGLVTGVTEIHGGHYEIFRDEDDSQARVENVSYKLGRACELLEEGEALEAKTEGWLLRF